LEHRGKSRICRFYAVLIGRAKPGACCPAFNAFSAWQTPPCGLVYINDQTVNDDVVNPFGVDASGNGTSIGASANWELFTE
jgi:hypothetical protein